MAEEGDYNGSHKRKEYMEYKDVRTRCLFCQATVQGNQRSMAGTWDSPNDLTPRWMFNEEESRPRWLWNGAGNPDTTACQQFYLCPEHNDPDHFDAAMMWAHDQSEKGEIIDFANLEAIAIPPLEDYRIGEEPSLPDQVPELGEIQNREMLPNAWQSKDPRLEGCLEIAYTITDTWDYSWSPFVLDRCELAWLSKPQELAEAMKKAARNIELLTFSDKRTNGRKQNSDFVS